MALETGTYISDLVATNPVGGDGKNQGDDHLRLIKSAIKATFPNVSGAVTATHTQLNAGKLLGVQIFTANGTYTPTTGTTFVVVDLQGGGGGSGGCVSTTAGQWAAGRPGAGGAWGRKKITSSFSGVSVTVGAGGTAGTSGDNAGGTGGTSSFGALVSCSGGGGGGGSGTVQTAAGFTAGAVASGGTATSADFSRPGDSPQSAVAISTTTLQMPPGGAAHFGPGGAGYVVTTNNSSGVTPGGYGGGASGPANINSTLAARAGSAGAPGIVIVYEYA